MHYRNERGITVVSDENTASVLPAASKTPIKERLFSFLAQYLTDFGRYICSVIVLLFIYAGRSLVRFFRFLWNKTVSLRGTLFTKLSYLGVIIASPFVKIWYALCRAKKDIVTGKQEGGLANGVKIAAGHLGEFVFGKSGLAVSVFNLAAPIISVLFLFSVVSYANSLNYVVKLTVNDKFLGYIRNEQVYYDAEKILAERINYLGSDENIRLEPEYSVKLLEKSGTLTKYQVADKMLEYSGLTVDRAYGFYLNGTFMGAMLDNTEVKAALDSVLNKYRTMYPEAEISFADHIECDTAGLYLSGSIINTDWLISQLTGVKKQAGYYIVEDGDSHSLICDKLSMTMGQLDLLNPGFADMPLYTGDRIKIREEVPFLSVNVTVVENYDAYIDYETEYYNDSTLYVGVTRVTTEGVRGVNHVTANVTYVNSIEVDRDITKSVTASLPVTERIAMGTKPTPESLYSPEDAGYGNYIWPVDGGHISEYTYWDGGYGRHAGVDIVKGYGAAIFAGASGTVIQAGSNGDYGNSVTIDHGNGFQTLYAHCSSVYVVVGQQVTQGEFIAAMGETGYAIGTHLHFEVRQGDVKYNPLDYLETWYDVRGNPHKAGDPAVY